MSESDVSEVDISERSSRRKKKQKRSSRRKKKQKIIIESDVSEASSGSEKTISNHRIVSRPIERMNMDDNNNFYHNNPLLRGIYRNWGKLGRVKLH